jgi:hypothetical protein
MRYFSGTLYATMTIVSAICMTDVHASMYNNEGCNQPENCSYAPQDCCSYACQCSSQPDRSSNFWIRGDFLFWTMEEGGFCNQFGDTTINTTVVANRPTTAITEHNKDLHFDWKPGFRVGLGEDFVCDGWDLAAYWTWYYGKGGRHSHANNTNNSAHLRMHYNTVDAVFGRALWTAPCFSLRPYTFVRFAYITQHLNSELETNIIAATGDSTVTSTTHNKGKFWGVGPEFGLEANIYFLQGFSFYTNFDAGVLYGHNKSKFYKKDLFTLVDNICDATSSCSGTQWVVDFGLGARYECRCMTFLLGFEHHGYFGFNTLGCGDGDLNLYGLVASIAARF